MNTDLIHVTIPTNGVRLHTVIAGPPDGEPVILLHGFPEFWYGWRRQIPALAAAGWRVYAPDQRGYNLSEKPRGVGAYTLPTLAADVIGLIDHIGAERVRLVGHDWGALVAWWVALRHPQRLHRLAILNVPHPAVMSRYLRSLDAEQVRRSWYVFFFQLPLLPEALFRAGGWAGGLRALTGSARPDTFTAEDLERYRTAWAQPGAITAMINWYRAAARIPAHTLEGGTRVRVPTRVIWGRHDVALSHRMAQASVDLCDEGDLHLIDEATHWVQHDAPERVNALLLDWLGR